MKPKSSFCVFSMVCIGILFSAFSRAQALEIALPDIQANPGATVQVPITVDEVSGILASNIRILYNHNVVEVTDVITAGTFTAGWAMSQNVNNVIGVMNIGVAVANHAHTGAGTFIIVEFEVKAGAGIGQVSNLVFDQAETILNADPPDVFTNGSITVAAGGGNAPPVLKWYRGDSVDVSRGFRGHGGDVFSDGGGCGQHAPIGWRGVDIGEPGEW